MHTRGRHRGSPTSTNIRSQPTEIEINMTIWDNFGVSPKKGNPNLTNRKKPFQTMWSAGSCYPWTNWNINGYINTFCIPPNIPTLLVIFFEIDLHVRRYKHDNISTWWIHTCMYVCMHVCMYVYVCMYISTIKIIEYVYGI
jgi:uncharacterized membrane protein YhaH (DUF805 family)